MEPIPASYEQRSQDKSKDPLSTGGSLEPCSRVPQRCSEVVLAIPLLSVQLQSFGDRSKNPLLPSPNPLWTEVSQLEALKAVNCLLQRRGKYSQAFECMVESWKSIVDWQLVYSLTPQPPAQNFDTSTFGAVKFSTALSTFLIKSDSSDGNELDLSLIDRQDPSDMEMCNSSTLGV